MKPDIKQQAQQIFLQALELEATDKEQYINQACHGQPELLAAVKALIQAEQQSQQFFQQLAGSFQQTHLNEIEDHCFRDFQVGQYQILHILKQGGMGSIFLARRANGEFERGVVIKMMPIGMNFNQNQVRFAHEKEILASLIHPNIVQLYDSGITNNGQPYFVMELFNGQDIVSHCNDRQLNIPQRIALFHQILKAVQYAHQHLVIHGDIKPSNILVNENSEIKLLDFGIARLMHQDRQSPSAYSIDYQTPEHANNQNITTTTDIHQLGQLLFELLGGSSPRNVKQADFAFPLLKDHLVNSVTHNRDAVSRHAANTSSQPKQLFNQLGSDLQLIVAKALKPKISDRYQTVQAFEDDLKKYASHHCITARPHTVGYRFQSYVRRHKLVFSFLSVLILMLLGLITITSMHNHRLSVERDKALTIKSLLVDVFNVADPSIAPGKELTATEVLDIGLSRVRARFPTPTATEADLLEEIATTYQNLGQYNKAQNILDDAHSIRSGLADYDAIAVAKGMMLLGENQRLLSNHDEAESWLNQALTVFKQSPDKHLAEIASVKNKLSRVKVLKGELDAAEKIALEAIAVQRKLYGENHLLYAQGLNDLSSVYFRQGKYQQVETILLETKKIREKLWLEKPLPILDKDYATNINNIGLAYYLQGKLTEGEVYFRQANELRNQIFSKPHPEQAQSLTNLGLLLNDAGKPDQALPYLQKALEIRSVTLDKDHMRVIDAWNNLAMVYHENAQFSQADEIYQRISARIVESRGIDHPQTASVYTNMANTLLALNQFEAAHDYLQASLNSRLKTLPEDHLYLSYSHIGLGRAKIALGQIKTGQEHISQGLQIRQQKLPADHWLLGEALYAHAMAQFVQGNDARETAQRACQILNDKKGENNFLTQKCFTLLTKITDRMP